MIPTTISSKESTGEDDARKNLFKALLEASDEDIAAFQRIIDLFASKKD